MLFLNISHLAFEDEIKKKLSILFFTFGIFLFILNLYYNFPDYFDAAIFWIAILTMVGTVLYQIFFLNNHRFVLFEIFIIYLSLHLMYSVGFYGLRGSDSYIDYNFLKNILNDHKFILGQNLDKWNIDGWPMIHLLSSAVSLITKIDPLLVAKFLPSFISSIIVLPIYLLAYTINKNKKIALFVCVLFGVIPQFVDFEATFVRETIALFFMFLFFYMLYASKKHRDFRLTLLAFFLIPVIVFSHHFTSFMVIILLGIYFFVTKFVLYFYKKNSKMIKKLSGVINIKTIFLSAIIITFFYWIYYATFIFEYSLDYLYQFIGFEDMLTYSDQLQLGSSIVTIRGNIIYYGFFFFHIAFSLILLIKLIVMKNREKIEDTTFTLYFFFCMFYAFLALYVLSSFLYPDRFLPFGWMFGFIPLTGLLLIIKKKTYKKILTVLLISFLMYNLYGLSIEYYTGNASLTGVVVTEKEYFIANQISFPEEYFGYGGAVAAIYDLQGIEQRTKGKDLSFIVYGGFSYNTTAVIDDDLNIYHLENLKEKSPATYNNLIQVLSYKNQKNVNKICEIGNVYVLKGSE